MFPTYWYWLSDDGRLYSSADQALVGLDNPTYLAWVGGSVRPTRWPEDDDGQQTDAALAAVLADHGLRLWPLTLDEIKAALCAEIDTAAEVERARYITPGAGQAMEYQQAATEAEALLAALAADPAYVPAEGTYPMLDSSVGIDGDTLADVAATVAAMHVRWRTIGSAIRRVRLAAKAAVLAADDEAGARSAAQVQWPG